jgi:hypothetical protein
MNQSIAVSTNSEFKDRRSGLIGFGILLIVLGCICALFIPLLMVVPVVTSKTNGIETDYRMIATSVLSYFALAVIFVTLGIGSCNARRWARALILIFAWTWLLIGIFAIGIMVFLMPKILAHMQAAGSGVPDSLQTGIMIIILGLLSIIFVLLPVLLVLFYGSYNVKATCEARDSIPRWTDACPLPALALSLLCGLGAVSMLPMLVIYHSVMPFFGHFVTGVPGTGMVLGMMVLSSYCAWAIYRLKLAGWWIILIGTVVLAASAAITYTQVDLMEMYRLAGYPEQQIEQIQKYNFFNGKSLALLMSLSSVLWIGFLFYVKKYFRQSV